MTMTFTPNPIRKALSQLALTHSRYPALMTRFSRFASVGVLLNLLHTGIAYADVAELAVTDEYSIKDAQSINAEYDADALPETTLPTLYVTGKTPTLGSHTVQYVVDREDIARFSEPTVGNLLRKMPAMSFSGPPGQVKDIRAFGLDKGYTEILLNGQRLPSASKDGQIQVDRIPTAMIERIEVVRAPSADMAGRGIGSTINIITREAKGTSGWLEVGTTASESHLSPQLSIGQTWANDNHQLGLMLSAITREEPKTKYTQEKKLNKAGEIESTTLTTETEQVEVKDINFAPTWQWNISDATRLTIKPQWQQSDETKTKMGRVNTQKAGTEALVAGKNSYELEDKVRTLYGTDISLEHQMASGWDWQLRASHLTAEEEKDRTKTQYQIGSTQVDKQELEKTQIDNVIATTSLQASQSFGNHLLSAGVTHEQEDFEQKVSKIVAGNITQEPKKNNALIARETSLWLGDRWQIHPNHAVTLGLRQEWHEQILEQENQKNNHQYQLTKPSLFYQWQAHPNVEVNMGVSRAVKMPKLEDLLSYVESKKGTLLDPDRAGNPELTPEFSINTDAGITYKPTDATELGLSYAHRDIKDVVEKQIRQQADGRYVQRPYNAGNATVDAWTALLKHRLVLSAEQNVQLYGSYSHLDSNVTLDDGSERRLNKQPEYIWQVGFDHHLPKGVSWGTFYSYLPVLKSVDDSGIELESAQKLLDVYVSKQISPNWSVKLTGSNLMPAEKKKDKQNGMALEQEYGSRSYLLSVNGTW